jgi:hypothetical protein
MSLKLIFRYIALPCWQNQKFMGDSYDWRLRGYYFLDITGRISSHIQRGHKKSWQKRKIGSLYSTINFQVLMQNLCGCLRLNQILNDRFCFLWEITEEPQSRNCRLSRKKFSTSRPVLAETSRMGHLDNTNNSFRIAWMNFFETRPGNGCR